MNSTEKVVALMKILGHEPYVYGVTELGEMIGCGKSGTFKLLSVLVKEGLAAQTADHKYTLGIMTYLLGKRYEENVGVVRAVRPYMQKLRDLTGEAVNRFTISYDTFNDLQTLAWQNMGDSQTLCDFIDWAAGAYPADRYILVLWDHGGGYNGVCFDETADYDSLTIHEVNDALYAYQQRHPSFRLDIIGFDACLMATYEMAAHMASYADYMVASEELEPGIGWNYQGWIGDLAANPEMSSADIAVSIADQFMAACLSDNPNDYLSQSVINLSAIPTLKAQLETFSAYLTDALNAQLDLGQGSGPLDHTLGGTGVENWMHGVPDAVQNK